MTPRRVLRALGRVVLVVAVVLIGALLWLQSPAGVPVVRAWVQDLIRGALAEGWTFDELQLEYGFGGKIRVHALRLSDPEGKEVLAVDRADLDVDLLRLLTGQVRLQHATLQDVVVALDTDDQGLLNLARAFGAKPDQPSAPWQGLPFTLIVDDLALRDGRVVFRTPDGEGGRRVDVATKVLDLTVDRLRLRRHVPGVELDGIDLAAVVLTPGPFPVLATGGVHLSQDAFLTEDLDVRAPGAHDSHVVLDGGLDDLRGQGGGSLTATVDRLDVGLIRQLTGAELGGVYAGELTATGPAWALGLTGALHGVDGTDGRVELGAGTLLCLPAADDVADRCSVPIGAAPPAVLPRFSTTDPLRWRADVKAVGFDVGDLVPAVAQPVVIDARAVLRGRGTDWPEGLWIDGRLDAGPVRVDPVSVEAAGARVHLERGVLSVDDLDVTGLIGHVAGSATLDLRDGRLEADAHGELDLARLQALGVEDLSGGGPFDAHVTGRVFDDPLRLTITGEARAAPVAWDGQIRAAAVRAPFEVEVRGPDVDVVAGVDARAVDLFGVTADRIVGRGVRIDVRQQGDLVTIRAARADVAGFDAFGVTTRQGVVHDLSVRIPKDRPVDIDIAVADLAGFDAFGITAAHARAGGLDMVAAPDGRFDFTSGGVTLAGVDAYGVTADEAHTGPLRVGVAGEGGAVDVRIEGADVGDLEAFGVGAEHVAVPSVDVTAAPSGETDVVLPGLQVQDVEGQGVTVDRAAMPAEGGTVDGEGALPPRPVVSAAPSSEAAIGRLEVHVEPSGETDVTLGEIGLRGVGFYGITADHALVERVDVHVDADGLARVLGRAWIDRAEQVETDSELRDVDVAFDVTAPRVGDPTVIVDTHVGAHRLFGLVGDHGDARIRIVGDLLDGDVTLWRGGEAWVSVAGLHLDLATRALTVASAELRPSWRQQWRSEGPLSVVIRDDGFSDAHVVLVSDLGRIEVEGTAGLTGPLDVHVGVHDLDLDALAELWPIALSGLDGKLTADLVASGTAEHPEVHAQIAGDQLFWEDRFRWLDVHGTVEVAGDVLTTDVHLGVAGQSLGAIVGTAPFHLDAQAARIESTGRADLRVVVDPGSLDRFEHLVPGLTLPEGQVSAALAVRGDLRDPELDLQGVVESEVVAGETLRLELDAERVASRLDVTADVYRGFEPVLMLTGSARTRIGEIMGWLLGGEPTPDWDDPSLYVEDVALTAELDELPVELIRDLAGLGLDVGGALSGAITLSGDPVRPTLHADVHGPLSLGEANADLALVVGSADLGYDLDLTLGQGDDTWVTARGRVPLSIDLTTPPASWAVSTWDVAVGGAGIPVAALGALDPGIVDARGRIVVSGLVRGKLLTPRPELQLALDGGEATILPIGLRVRELSLRGAVDAQAGERVAVRLEELRAVTRPTGTNLQNLTQAGPSRIEGKGSVVLEGFRLSTVRGELRLNEAWVVALDRSMLRASGELFVQGRWPELLLTGDLEVDQGSFELNIAELTAPAAIDVDPSITVHRAGVTWRREVVAKEPTLFDRLDLDVDLDLGRNTSLLLRVPLLDAFGAFGAALTRADVSARLGGQIHATMTDGDLSLVGIVEALSGTVSVLRGRFDIQQGSTITFYGGDYTNPQLDVRGSMSVSGGQIDLALLGPATSPTFTLNSSTWGNDVATLFTILLTGRAPDDLTGDQGRAALEAAGNLLLSSVLGNVSLGSVQVDASGAVRVGIPVYRTVFVETTYNPNARVDQNTITVQLEWSILPKLLLQAAYGNRRIFGNLVYELRLTTLCDKAREVYKLIPNADEVESVESSCHRIRQRIAEAGGVEAVEKAARERRARGRLVGSEPTVPLEPTLTPVRPPPPPTETTP